MVDELQLTDLHNPRKVTALLLTRGRLIEPDTDQGLQEYPGSWELWQKMDDGRLLRVCRWLKKSVICAYTN